MSKNKNSKFRGTADTAARTAAIQGRRGSGAAGGHDSRPKCERTRAASKRAAILHG